MSKNLIQRSLSAIILGPAFLFSIYWNRWSYFTLFAIILVLGLHEFFNMFKQIVSQKNKIFGIAASLTIYIVTFFCASENINAKYLASLPALFLLLFIMNLYSKDLKGSILEISTLLFGIIYLALPLSIMHFGVFKEKIYSTEIVFTVIFCVWASDTGGYIFGSLFGRHKLFEKISQKKTWEGVIGGVLLSICISYAASIYFNTSHKNNWISTGILISVASIYGDLVESLLKRGAGIKDSSNLIPGHGGILDRFDSFLFAIVVMIFCKTVFGFFS